MSSQWSSARFPQVEPALRRLTAQHREIEDDLPIYILKADNWMERDEGQPGFKELFPE